MKLTANVRRAIAQVPWPEWDGQPGIGMKQYAETRVKLEGWSTERRVIVTRTLKPANPSPQDVFWGTDQEEFCAYVTNLDALQSTPAQIVLTKGGLNTKLAAVGDQHGRAVDVVLAPGPQHDLHAVAPLRRGLRRHRVVADKGFDAALDWFTHRV